MARTTNSTNGNSDYIDLVFNKTLSVPAASKDFSIGQKVKLLNHATQYQTGQRIPAHVKNKNYTIQQIKNVNQSSSKKAYLLKEIMSWVLSQDLG